MPEVASTPERLVRRLAALEAQRQPFEGSMRQCFDYTFPERGAGLNGNVFAPQDARAKRAEIYDDTAKDSARTLASSIPGGMTPANSQWFGLDVGGNESDQDKRWLGDAAQFLFDNIHAANFDTSAFECAVDIVSGGGHFVQYIEEAEAGGFRFESWPIGQCFISASKSGGRVDTIYRRFTLTVEQCAAEWGVERLSERTRELHAQGRLDDPVEILWAIEPRAAARGHDGARLAKAKPWASCKVEVGAKHLVAEGGYDEFPCAVPRWMLIPGSHYATSPVASCIATVRTLNKVKELDLVNFEMAAYGMFKATDDGVLNPFTTVIGPRRIVVVADMDNFQPVETGGNVQLSMFAAEQMQAAIRKAMLADVLHPRDPKDPVPTATQVHADLMLLRQLLGPIFGRLQAEWLRALLERCFGIALRSGALVWACGPIPPTLRGRLINVNYSSPLARAQKLEEVTATDSWVGSIVAYAQATQDASVLDEIDTTYLAQFRRDALGVPSRAQRSAENVARIRQQRIEAQRQAAQAQQQLETQSVVAQEHGKAMAQRAAAGA